jgi:hypothetical protein
MVDQFGYLPEMAKIAVGSHPQDGFNATHIYTPGPRLEVRECKSETVVFAAPPVPWRHGMLHLQSGDRVWWFDFSAVTNAGQYYVYDPAHDVRSARFRVANDVYVDVLKQAVRMFFYQRRNAAKLPPFADPRWQDGPNFLGPLQDRECRLITQPSPATQKDLRGGWFDAGDYNKSIGFSTVAISAMLSAYQKNPGIWPDDWNIPESGNGVPDLLDEIKWELDFQLRMQNADGSVLCKVGVSGFQGASPPSSERAQAFYGGPSTLASFMAAGNFSQASPLYASVGLVAYANTLSNAAVAAYGWAVTNPIVIFTNTGFSINSPEEETATSNNEREKARLRAAVCLYALTRQPAYQAFVESSCAHLSIITNNQWDVYNAPVQDALLRFSVMPGVSPTVAAMIRRSKQASIDGPDFMGAWAEQRDAYRAFLTDEGYHWGSNANKSQAGLLFVQQNDYGLNPAQAVAYREAAAGYLHYLHGVNPLAMVYLTNMREHGAEFSANAVFHSWYAAGTVYGNALASRGPAPGYIPGGPNKNFRPAAAYTGPWLAPPMDQPPQKAYRDWGAGWPQDSWEITEPALGYQGPYVALLSHFVPSAAP